MDNGIKKSNTYFYFCLHKCHLFLFDHQVYLTTAPSIVFEYGSDDTLFLKYLLFFRNIYLHLSYSKTKHKHFFFYITVHIFKAFLLFFFFLTTTKHCPLDNTSSLNMNFCNQFGDTQMLSTFYAE